MSGSRPLHSIGLIAQVKNHPTPSQPVEVRGFVKVRTHVSRVAPAKIIKIDKQDVGLIGKCGKRCPSGHRDGDQQNSGGDFVVGQLHLGSVYKLVNR